MPLAFAADAALPSPEFVEPVASFTGIDFLRGGSGELVVHLDSDQDIAWHLLPPEPGRMHYVFPGTRVPTSLARVYQLHEFSHPVKNALLRNTSAGSELIVTATGPVSMETESGPGSLKLRFGILADTGWPTDADPEKTAPALISEHDDQPHRDAQTIFPGMDPNYKGEPISIDVQNIGVEHVLRLINEIAGYNLILDPEVGDRMSMKLENVPWDQALDLVLIQQGLGKVRVGNILRISTIERLGAERKLISDAKAEIARAHLVEQELEPVQTAFIQVNYSTTAEIDARTRPFLTKDRGKMSHDPRTNMLIITDVPANIRKIRGIVERLDKPERQVLIEARIVYATESFQRGMGIKWGGGIGRVTTEYLREVYGAAGGARASPGRGTSGYLVNIPYPGPGVASFGIGGFISRLVGPDLFTLDAQLQLGELKGESKTVSSPRIVTLSNHEAEIEQGVSMAVTMLDAEGIPRIEYVDAVLKMTVRPQITPNDALFLDVFVSDEDPLAGGDIERKRAQTRLLVEDGQIVVLGGVLKSIERLDVTRAPGIADIPLLGRLFKSQEITKQDRELLIFIRPTIL